MTWQMSNQSFKKVLVDIGLYYIKEAIRTMSSISRKTPSVSKKHSSIEKMIVELESGITRLEKQRAKKDIIYHKNTPVLRSLNEIITSTPENLTYLLGGLMIEGGIYVLFSHKGQGKSTFAMQMGIALAKGESMKVFEDYNMPSNTNPQYVIYLDYELSAAQIKARYNGIDVQNFHWAGPCQSANTSDLVKLAEQYIHRFPKGENVVLFIDNLTKIGSGYIFPTEARELYAKLNRFKSMQKEQFDRTITIVLITHTQKDAKMGTPITQNNYSGAQDIIISADGVFAIGPTKFGNDTKLFKVLNNRNAKEPNSVSVMRHVNKPYSHFEIIDEMTEDEALAGRKTVKQTSKGMSARKKTESKYPDVTRTIVEEMRKKLGELNPDTGKNYTQKDLAEYYGVPPTYVSDYLRGKRKLKPDSNSEIREE